jgi:large subunit ribosomal protein L20
MARVKKGVTKLRRHKKILKQTKGFRWGRSSRIRIAHEAVLHAHKFRYRDRKAKKRVMRALWNVRLNAALHPLGMSYSRFIDALKKHKIELDRKVLSQIAADYPKVFEKIVEEVKSK